MTSLLVYKGKKVCKNSLFMSSYVIEYSVTSWVSLKHRTWKRRPQTLKTQTSKTQENADLENTDLEYTALENADLENVVCVLTEKLRSFMKSNGKRRFKRTQNYHRNRPDINCWAYPKFRRWRTRCGFPTLFFFDHKCSSGLQKIERRKSWSI